jgi:hypothetical protein
MHVYVLSKEVYPEYEYVQLNAANLSRLVQERTFYEKQYRLRRCAAESMHVHHI